MKKSVLKRLAEALRFDLVVERTGNAAWQHCKAGRKGFGDASLLGCTMLSPLYDAESIRKTGRKLEEDRELRKIFNLKKAPDHSSLSKWLKRKGIDFLSKIMKELVKVAMRIGLIRGDLIAIDSTGIDSFTSKANKTYSTDPSASWGYLKKGKDGEAILFHGYKVHLAVDCNSELPVAFAVLPANVHDSDGFGYAFDSLKNTIPSFQIKKVLADAGYDTAYIKQYLRDINIIPAIAINGRGHYASAKPKDPDYSKRWAIERNNGLMKKHYGLNDLKVKGIEKATKHCYVCYISMLASSIGKYVLGYKRYRSIY